MSSLYGMVQSGFISTGSKVKRGLQEPKATKVLLGRKAPMVHLALKGLSDSLGRLGHRGQRDRSVKMGRQGQRALPGLWDQLVLLIDLVWCSLEPDTPQILGTLRRLALRP